MTIVCLGEALVDMVCEHPVADLSDADSFVPHCGGALTNVARVSSLVGADVMLAGGAGDDAWGRWIERELKQSKVSLRWWRLHPEVPTPVAFVAINRRHEPDFLIYGRDIDRLFEHLDTELERLTAETDLLVVGSNTLVARRERELTLQACKLAREANKPVVFDPNLRPNRWRESDSAIASCQAVLELATVLKISAEEACQLGNTEDPVLGAEQLSAGRAVVLTLGADGAIFFHDGESTRIPGESVATVDTTGAGDVLLGVLLARFSSAGLELDALRSALPEAVQIAALSTTRYGAVSGIGDFL